MSATAYKFVRPNGDGTWDSPMAPKSTAITYQIGNAYDAALGNWFGIGAWQTKADGIAWGATGWGQNVLPGLAGLEWLELAYEPGDVLRGPAGAGDEPWPAGFISLAHVTVVGTA